MLDSYYRLSVPAELSDYYVTNAINGESKSTDKFQSNVIINRDSLGQISSVKYLTPENEISKEIFYNFEQVCKIKYYRNGVLYSTEEYNNDTIVQKSIFLTSGILSHKYNYEYNKKKQIISICKKKQDTEILVVYKYDDFDRVSSRKIYLNYEKILEQNYIYDILDRIIEYKDNNQRIVVKKMNNKNALLSYEITDKMNNNIFINNEIIECGYICTHISVNGHNSIVKDYSYVDNVMLKKPYTSEDDLDLIIANLFSKSPSKIEKNKNLDKLSNDIINREIEIKVLPISIRKRVLYNQIISQSLL